MLELSEETEVLARRIAQVRRVAVDDVVREALETQARAEGVRVRDDSSEATAARRARIEAVALSVSGLPVLDARPTQEIIDELNEA